MAKYVYQIGSLQALDNSLVTVYLQPGQSLSDLENGRELLESPGHETMGLVDKIASPSGVAVFYDTLGMVREAVAPFLPVDVSFLQMDVRFDTAPLQELMDRKVNLCVLLVHAGESFIGITDNPGSFTDRNCSMCASSVRMCSSSSFFPSSLSNKYRSPELLCAVQLSSNCEIFG